MLMYLEFVASVAISVNAKTNNVTSILLNQMKWHCSVDCMCLPACPEVHSSDAEVGCQLSKLCVPHSQTCNQAQLIHYRPQGQAFLNVLGSYHRLFA